MDLRSLYPRVGVLRPDLPEAVYGFVLQEAARRICRELLPLKETVEFNTEVGTWEYTLSIPTTRSVLRIDSVEWYNPLKTRWEPLFETNYKMEEQENRWFFHVNGEHPTRWADKVGKVVLFPTPTVSQLCRAYYQYQPVGDFNTIDFLPEHEDALVFLAIGDLMLHGGTGMNIQTSELYKQKYQLALSELKIGLEYGYSGDIWMKPMKRF